MHNVCFIIFNKAYLVFESKYLKFIRRAFAVDLVYLKNYILY